MEINDSFWFGFWITLLVISTVCSLIGHRIGKNKRIGSNMGAILGFFFGVIGLIIIACSKEEQDVDSYYHDLEIEKSYEKLNEEKLKKISAVDELKKWHDLKVAGAITEKEFEEKKKELIKS